MSFSYDKKDTSPKCRTFTANRSTWRYNAAPTKSQPLCGALWFCRWRCPRRLTILVMGVTLFIMVIIQLYSSILPWREWTGGSTAEFSIYHELLRENANKFCTFPQIDPWDASIKKYLSRVEPIKCKRLQPEVIYVDTDARPPRILFNESELRSAGYASMESVFCQFRCFGKMSENDFIVKYDEWNILTNGTPTLCEFVETRCYGGRFSVMPFYVNAHVQFQEQLRRDMGLGKRQPSVLLFVVDSVSHSNWLRSLPKTLRVLRNVYNATVLNGFTKVADNSYPNAIAFLTGTHPSYVLMKLITKFVGKRIYARDYPPELKEDMFDDFFDDWPLIWREFHKSGYITYYGEDFVDFNLFTYLSKGFRKAPTDHYFRPFWLHVAKSFLFRRSSSYCYGNNVNHRLQLNYLAKLIRSYSDLGQPFFALNWLSELSHDWMNQVAAGDKDFARFFNNAHDQLKNEFVFVFADHGHRFDSIRQSLVGRIEERMPFFSVHVPDWLYDTLPTLRATLNNNAQRLTTFWDLYVTLRDINYLSETDSWSELNFTSSSFAVKADVEQRFRGWSPRGYSLLREVSAKRNCELAGIPQEFCVCQREYNLNVTDTRVQDAANFLVAHVNEMITGNDIRHQCAPLTLLSVSNAQVFLPSLNLIQSPPSRSILFADTSCDFFLNYRITVEVAPSGAILEATVRHQFPEDLYTVVGDVNRINKYENQSICVKSPVLRKYCFCVGE